MSAIANHAASERLFWSVFSPEILLPVQLADHDTSRPEKRLMLAVLEAGVATFQRHREAKTPRNQRLFREVEDWIRSTDTSWPFAFENVCHTLGLDPEYLRAGLERLKQRRPGFGVRVYRFRRVSGRRTSIAPVRASL
jgi:hypothetical protein